MVHYDPDSLKAAQPHPPVCPRCGSHRTEIIGLSDDGRTMTLRCNACGERSRIDIVPAADGRRARAHDEDGSEELGVMRLIGRALAQLPDAESRMRVLRWASERFLAAPTPEAVAPVLVRTFSASDQALSLDGMELFEDASERDELEDAAPAPALPERLDALLDGFVSDFQRMTVALQSV